MLWLTMIAVGLCSFIFQHMKGPNLNIYLLYFILRSSWNIKSACELPYLQTTSIASDISSNGEGGVSATW